MKRRLMTLWARKLKLNKKSSELAVPSSNMIWNTGTRVCEPQIPRLSQLVTITSAWYGRWNIEWLVRDLEKNTNIIKVEPDYNATKCDILTTPCQTLYRSKSWVVGGLLSHIKQSRSLSHNSINIRKHADQDSSNTKNQENRSNSNRERSKWKIVTFWQKWEMICFPWFSWYYYLSTRVLRRRLLSLIVGRYRTTVGRYRKKISQFESTRSGLFRTPKNLKIGPIATENDTNEKGHFF